MKGAGRTAKCQQPPEKRPSGQFEWAYSMALAKRAARSNDFSKLDLRKIK
jgi:hypothetical protein